MNALKEATDKMGQESDEPAPQTPATRQWESQGISLNSCHASLPEGILAISVTHYQVGKYSYTNLDDAMAEHRRQSGSDIAAQEVSAREVLPK